MAEAKEIKPALTAAKAAKIAKLLVAARELHDKQGLIYNEIDNILDGRASLGDQMNKLAEAFDLAWASRYAGAAAGSYVWTHSKDRPLLKQLVQSGVPLEELMQRAQRYLRDDFHAKHRHGFAVFKSQVNRYVSANDSTPDLELASAPSDCKHKPRCKDDHEHTRRRSSDLRATA